MMQDKNESIQDVQDITQLQKENKRLQKRIDRITDQGDRQHKQFEKLNESLQGYINIIDDHIITVTVDKDLSIKSVSTAFSNAFGFTMDEIKGKSYDFLLNKEYIERFRVEIIELQASGLPWHGELLHVTKAEGKLWTNSNIRPIYGDDDQISGYTIVSRNITEEKELEALKASKLSDKEYSQSMLQFMGSKSSALLQRTSKKISYTLWALFAAITWFILWANLADIDELARASGKVIPSKQIQRVQSIDGGRVEHIYKKEGMIVKKGEILFKLNELESNSAYTQNNLRLQELLAKKVRLHAEANRLAFRPKGNLFADNPNLIANEKSLYLSNIKQLRSRVNALKEQRAQSRNKLSESQEKFKRLHDNHNLLEQEILIKKGLLKDKIISKIEFLQLNRQKNELLVEINSVEKEIVKSESSVIEITNNIEVAKLEFINKAKKELNDISSEIDRLQKTQITLSDKVRRTAIYAPMDGTINKINVTTQGEVVKAGNILAEIVPLEDTLIVEVNIKPSDIAFLRLNQEAMVKFSSYDFGVYGGLKGEIIYIGADTIVNETDNQSYYAVQIKTDKNYLGSVQKPLYIKVGMVTDVDILLGKKSVMDYILKPIMKAKQGALSER